MKHRAFALAGLLIVISIGIGILFIFLKFCAYDYKNAVNDINSRNMQIENQLNDIQNKVDAARKLNEEYQRDY